MEDRRTSHGVFILVDKVLGDVLKHELVSFIWHPGVNERCEIESRGAVKFELIMDELVSRLGVDTLHYIFIVLAMHDASGEITYLCGHPELWNQRSSIASTIWARCLVVLRAVQTVTVVVV